MGKHQLTVADGLARLPGPEGDTRDFTDDLVVWVFFYGPEGGEAAK